MFIDTHCHLNFNAFKDDWRQVADAAVKAGVHTLIVVGADLASSQRAVVLAQDHPAIYAAVGIHPHHAKAYLRSPHQFDPDLNKLRLLAQQPRVVAIGEIGLDRHVFSQSQYSSSDQSFSPQLISLQQSLFESQLELAHTLHLPVILHSREVGESVLQTALSLRARTHSQLPGVFHCFAGSKAYLKRVVEAGFYLGFDGNLTYVPDRLTVASQTPLDRLLLETDSPWLTPAPHRGQRNQPSLLPLIAQTHAAARGLDPNVIAHQTTLNARTLFNLPASD